MPRPWFVKTIPHQEKEGERGRKGEREGVSEGREGGRDPGGNVIPV